MATKRGYCPYCSNKNSGEHFFDVNPDAKVCYCPHCMKGVSPDEAIKAYNNHVDGLLREANFALYEQWNPEVAYRLYAEILEFEDYNTLAFLGRLQCLLFMSKVRRSYIEEASTMLNSELDQYHKASESSKYIQALRRMNNIVDEYEKRVRKALTVKKYFYDVDCLKLYFKHLYSIVKFKETLLDEANYISRRFKEQKADLLINLLEIKIEEQFHLLKEVEYITVDGKHYLFDKVKKNGEVELIFVEEKVTTPRLSHYRMCTLNPNDKSKHYINDIIFKDYTKIMRTKKSSIWLNIISFVLAAGCGVTSYFFFGTDYIFYPLAAGGVLFLGLSIFFLVLYLRSIKLLKDKKKMQVL